MSLKRTNKAEELQNAKPETKLLSLATRSIHASKNENHDSHDLLSKPAENEAENWRKGQREAKIIKLSNQKFIIKVDSQLAWF